LKIDVKSKEVRCNYKEVDIGVADSKALTQTSISDRDRKAFRMQCVDFLRQRKTLLNTVHFAMELCVQSHAQYQVQEAVTVFWLRAE